MLVGRRTKLEEELAAERRKFFDKPDCIYKKNAQEIEWGIKLIQSEIDYHISQVGSDCDHVHDNNNFCQFCGQNLKKSWEHKCAECHNHTLTDFGPPNGLRDYEWMKKRISEIGDLIPKLEDEAFHFERECECKKPDCHKQLKAKHLKEQIVMLDNERRELKEKVNKSISDFSGDKQAKERFDQEEREKSLSEKEEGEDYSFAIIQGRKFAETCFDCGAKGTVEMITYFSCNLCGEKKEGDGNWRCEKCNNKKFPKHLCKRQKNKGEEKDKTNPPQSPINITINNNVGQGNSDNALENKKLEQIVQEIELLKQKIAQLEKTGINPQKVQELKYQVQNLEAQKQAHLNQQKSEPVEKNQEIKEKKAIPNSVPTKPENYKTTLPYWIGGGLLIACALAIGYFLGKAKTKGGKEEEKS